MISLQKRFLFVHIPKTAGNSIQSVLRDYSEDQLVALRKEQDGIERFGLRNPKYKIKKHSMLSEYHDALGDEQFRDLYKFTCVRNPWDRMVSYYFTPTQNPETWDSGAPLRPEHSHHPKTRRKLQLTNDLAAETVLVCSHSKNSW